MRGASRCFTCFTLGGDKKLNTIGIRISEISQVDITFAAATNPNSISNLLSVKYNTKNPIAVVTFAKNVVNPIRCTILDKAIPCEL